MKKAFIVGLILTGCGPSFEPTNSNTSISSENNDGGVSTTETVSSSVSTSQTESTTDVININDLLEIPVANCEDNFVYVPWTGYQLNDAPILSCMPLLLGQDSLQPKYFRYSLYGGKTPWQECKFNDHEAIYAITEFNENNRFLSSTQIINSNNKSGSNKQFEIMPDFFGSRMDYLVKLPDDISVTENSMFCFGHKVSVLNETSTCPIGCLTQLDNDKYHQMSDHDVNPYNFNPLNSWPIDGDVTKKVMLSGSVFVSK